LPLPPVREVSYEEPLKSRVQRHFDALAHHWNLPRSMGKYLMWGAFLLVVIPIAILCWYGLRRVQK
jgi:uncharacterized membrane protein YraQ (UPF0718 family)